MDPATARLALKLQLDDVDALRELAATDTDAATTSEMAALEAQREELVEKWQQVTGQYLASHVPREENRNRIAFKHLLSGEEQAERDHGMACNIAGRSTPQLALPSKKRAAYIDPAVLREQDDGRTKRVKLQQSEPPQIACDDKVTAKTASPARPADSGSVLNEENLAGGLCSSCMDMYPNRGLLQLGCKGKHDSETHAYCRDCVMRLFESSVTDPSHFPPRCCSKIIPLLRCIPFLPQELFSRFVARREELDTPNRTYCSNTACSKWIRPVHIKAGVAQCLACAQNTCVTCKGIYHTGLCPKDKDVEKLMKVARRRRWQTCPACKEMVELARGCYHITCRCRHEFCYLCLAKWRTCQCPAYDERNIIDAPPPAAGPAQQAAAAPNPRGNIPPHPQPDPAPRGFANPAPNHQPAAVYINGRPAPFGHPAPAPFGPPAPAMYGHPVHPGYDNPAPAVYGNFPPPPYGNSLPHAHLELDQWGAHRGAWGAQFGAAFHGFGAPRFGHIAAPAAPPIPICEREGHDFERYYRRNGWRTDCDWCDESREDRWINWCGRCDLTICWHCTKHRT